MKLSDVVSALHLSIFAEIPLSICFGVFIGVVLHVLRARPEFERMGQLPLSEPELTPAQRGDQP
ncbi:MAG: hypothetical protein QM756_44435 [Polyangiaceae bacterium]